MYTFCHYAFFFFAYSVIGWVGEEIYAFFKYGRFVNRGLLNGPVCPQYGMAMVLILADVSDLSAYPMYQMVICVGLMAVFQCVAGVLIHRFTGRKPWDHSQEKFNIGGYVSARSVLFLGLGAALCVWMVNPILYIVYSFVPTAVMKVVLVILTVVFLIDLFVTWTVSAHWKLQGNIYGRVAKGLDGTKKRLGSRLFEVIRNRMYKAFPEFEGQEPDEGDGFGRPENRVFAAGLSVEKLIWVFLISALLGDIIETVFLWVVDGQIMSRSSVLYGPFSVVWGLGGVLISVVLCPMKKRGNFAIFVIGTVLGGVYEYSCSVFTEMVWGTVYWDYSHIPYNINGRVNLLYCFFWGFAAVAWVRLVYPSVSRLVEKIPPVAGKVITVIVAMAMVLNMGISSLAVARYVERGDEVAPTSAVDVFMDTMYPDEFIDKVYPNMWVK